MSKKQPLPDPVRDYLSSIGKKGGSSRSEAKIAASKVNAKGHGRPKGAKDKQPRKRTKR